MTIEKDWITVAGLRAVCWMCTSMGRKTHRCGYVEVPAGHPLHGISYGEPCDLFTQADADGQTLGKKSPILMLTAAVRGDDDESRVRRSPDIVFDCHGGLTYSGGGDSYPAAGDGWWFGFDCAHSGDGVIEPSEIDLMYPRDGDEVRSLEYVEQECERLAAQIVERFPVLAT